MVQLSLENLTKIYPNGVAGLWGLTLEVAQGEILVLFGPSGSGKTTTLRLIAGLETPTSGTIRVDGKSIDSLPPCRRNVGFVFQRPVLYPHLTVRRNLLFPWELRHSRGRMTRAVARLMGQQRQEVSRAQAVGRVADLSAMLGIVDLLERRPDELSGGQQQRVALGRALVMNPELLLLDEPFSNLDAPLRMELRRDLHLLQRRLRTTMVYVTHDEAEAKALADRLAVLERGRLV